MANAVYAIFWASPAGQNPSIDLAADTIKAALVTPGYTANLAGHQYYSSVSAYVVGTPTALAGKSVIGGVFAASPTTFPAVSGSQAAQIILFKDTGTPSASPLIARLDSVTGLPLSPTGVDLVVTWGNIFSNLVAGPVAVGTPALLASDGSIIGDYPDGSNVAGPTISLLIDAPTEHVVEKYQFDDGGMDVNIQPCGSRQWTLEYDSLTQAEIALLRGHWNLARGKTRGFSFYSRRDATVHSGVRYLNFRIGRHSRNWAVPVTVTLVKY